MDPAKSAEFRRFPFLTPKIEPKPEPIDEFPPPPPPPPNDDVFAEYSRLSMLFNSSIPLEKGSSSGSGSGSGSVSGSGSESLDSGAIVPFKQDPPEPALKKNQTRCHELVRVTTVRPAERFVFLGIVRKTRILYASLRAFDSYNIEESLNSGMEIQRKRKRMDLTAGKVMRERGLWLNTEKRLVGTMPGIEIGDIFPYRMEMCVLGLHGQPQAGIDYVPVQFSSNGEPIATSITVSGGYEDDEDAGDVIIYTGHGGMDKNKHVKHQLLESGNLGMERSWRYGVELRVIRGMKYDGFPTGKIYVYDGLYRIVDGWFDTGKSGFGVYKFKLVRIENQAEMGSSIMKFAARLKANPLAVRPRGYVSLDLSNKKESVPVFFYNDIDDCTEPVRFDYLVSTVFPHYLYSTLGSSGSGCGCEGECLAGCHCFVKNGYQFPYDRSGILLRGKPLIFECGPNCRCPPTCRNRVSQKGLKYHLEVFRSRETGWGVRSLDLIQAGSFICEFAGVALTAEQAQLFTMNGDHLVHPRRFTERWKEWGDLSQAYPDYAAPSYPSIPPLDFAMDVSRVRNVACYISHSVLPNVFVQLVLYDHNNLSFPHLMLFAMENIPPMRELGLDYGVADESMGKLAIC